VSGPDGADGGGAARTLRGALARLRRNPDADPWEPSEGFVARGPGHLMLALAWATAGGEEQADRPEMALTALQAALDADPVAVWRAVCDDLGAARREKQHAVDMQRLQTELAELRAKLRARAT
jgi:hypothetical protein